jgi:hypothetical protein
MQSNRRPLWSSSQSAWLHIQRSRFNSRRCQIFWEVVLGRKGSGSGLEIQEYGSGDPLRRPRGSLSPQKLTLTLLTSDSRSVGIVRSRTQATEFSLCNHTYFYVLFIETDGVVVLLHARIWEIHGSNFGSRYVLPISAVPGITTRFTQWHLLFTPAASSASCRSRPFRQMPRQCQGHGRFLPLFFQFIVLLSTVTPFHIVQLLTIITNGSIAFCWTLAVFSVS